MCGHVDTRTAVSSVVRWLTKVVQLMHAGWLHTQTHTNHQQSHLVVRSVSQQRGQYTPGYETTPDEQTMWPGLEVIRIYLHMLSSSKNDQQPPGTFGDWFQQVGG